VPALVPGFGAAAEDVVVLDAGLFDQPLQADVPAHLVAVLVEDQKGQQARDPAVAVAEGVDAEEVEDQAGVVSRSGGTLPLLRTWQ